jgi:ribosome biogenesis SPOUT family RNA methylase Rps3
VEHLVVFGHHLSEYKRLIEQHGVDLLVLNTKDEDQLAMRGIAYALAVELRQIPLLML